MTRTDQNKATEPSPADQLKALRETAAVGFTSPGLARFRARGSDAEDYLHRRLTNTVTGLAPGDGRHALLLGGDGRMQADFLIYNIGEAFEILVQEDNLAEAFELLGKYVIVEDVELAKAAEGERSIALAGPKAPDVLAEALGLEDAATSGREGKGKDDTGPPVFEIAGSPVSWFADGRYAMPRFHIFCSGADAEKILAELLAMAEKVGGTLCKADPWEFDRVANGITRFGVETDSKSIPLNAALWDAVDFDKGCFPGQEMLARIHNLGQPARRLLALTVPEEVDLKKGASVHLTDGQDAEAAGKILSARTLPGTGQTVALAEIAWKHWESKTGVTPCTVQTESGSVAAEARAVRTETEPEFSGK